MTVELNAPVATAPGTDRRAGCPRSQSFIPMPPPPKSPMVLRGAASGSKFEYRGFDRFLRIFTRQDNILYAVDGCRGKELFAGFYADAGGDVFDDIKFPVPLERVRDSRVLHLLIFHSLPPSAVGLLERIAFIITGELYSKKASPVVKGSHLCRAIYIGAGAASS